MSYLDPIDKASNYEVMFECLIIKIRLLQSFPDLQPKWLKLDDSGTHNSNRNQKILNEYPNSDKCFPIN